MIFCINIFDIVKNIMQQSNLKLCQLSNTQIVTNIIIKINKNSVKRKLQSTIQKPNKKKRKLNSKKSVLLN